MAAGQQRSVVEQHSLVFPLGMGLLGQADLSACSQQCHRHHSSSSTAAAGNWGNAFPDFPGQGHHLRRFSERLLRCLLSTPGHHLGGRGFNSLEETSTSPPPKQGKSSTVSPQGLCSSAKRGKAHHTCTEPPPSLRAGITPFRAG